ncbi:MAG: hypothetical protein ACYC97_05650 [Metallibacterium sp.]
MANLSKEDVYYAFKELKEDILGMLLDNEQIADEYYDGEQDESNDDIEDIVNTLNDMLAIVSGHEDSGYN